MASKDGIPEELLNLVKGKDEWEEAVLPSNEILRKIRQM